jgi:hypothetical protein
MRVHFDSEGGFAHFPGLSQPVSVDTDELPPEQAARVEQLVRAANFFSQPDELAAPAPGAADYRTYTITVEDGGRSHTVRAAEPVEDQGVRALIEHLQAVQRGAA